MKCFSLGHKEMKNIYSVVQLPSLKSTQMLKKGKERGRHEGEERSGQGADALPALTAKDRRYVCWTVRIPGSMDD